MYLKYCRLYDYSNGYFSLYVNKPNLTNVEGFLLVDFFIVVPKKL